MDSSGLNVKQTSMRVTSEGNNRNATTTQAIVRNSGRDLVWREDTDGVRGPSFYAIKPAAERGKGERDE